MRKIILISFLTLFVIILIQVVLIYSLFSGLEYRLPNISQISNMLSGESFNLEIINDKPINLYIRDLNISLEKNGRFMGGFAPINLNINRGTNLIDLKFLPNTKFGQIGIDYFTNNLNNYKLVFKGKLFGFLPFTYRMREFL